MDAHFWLDRWNKKEIGFHKAEVNPSLLSVRHLLHSKKGQRVLVPLCGKSLDMVWFAAQGLVVTGVELSSVACEEFFSENSISFKKITQNGFEVYQSDQITLWCGDFFKFRSKDKFDLIYDRAANIALPPQMRSQYYSQIQQFISEATQLCLITIQYDQKLIEGPPFSVSEEETLQVYSKYVVTPLSHRLLPMDNPRFEQARVEVTENIYLIGSRN